ncbi:interferon lambda receptor 1 isoform X2 [Pseudoliparis swirei]|uniref:interferon lambda receptor 1 isoform X2 n=1 Tax=Pseudoliparis swirei TaxID=2059687 RepID=UPI0024BDBCDE|nr:interferon lambda receptor 1 isoform X2 [Pseudoliparis swirei]
MKMWSMKVIILLLFCYASLSTGNERPYFVSRNFYNVLHWDLMKPAFPGEKVLYSVQYWSDATEKFQIKEECQNITALSCDLTAETPSVHDVQYLAKVYCNGHSCGITERLKPIAHTVFGPPTVSTYPRVSSLDVNVTLPLGPKGVSIADIITSSKKGPSKAEIVFVLKITHPTWAAQVHESTTGQFVISLKNNQTEYCGYVVYNALTEWGRPPGEQAPFCVTLPGDPLTLLPWFLVGAVLLTAVVTTSVVCMCNYARGGKEKSIPKLLVTTFSTPTTVLQSPDRNLIISKAEVCIQSDQTVYATIRMKPNMPSVGSGGYSPQDILCQAWQDGTGSSFGTGERSMTPNPESTSAQSSEIYSVVAVHAHNEDIHQATNDNRETCYLPTSSSGEIWDKAGASPKLSSRGVQPLPHPDPCEGNPAKPLLLETERDTNGLLVLSPLVFQLQNSTDDTMPPLNPDRKPLLSDLTDSMTGRPSWKSIDGSEFSDSGCDEGTVTTPTQAYCNTHYSPSQPVAPYFQQGWKNPPSRDGVLEAGYKQNWLPAILLETSSEERCEYRKTDYPRTWTGPKMEEQGG